MLNVDGAGLPLAVKSVGSRCELMVFQDHISLGVVDKTELFRAKHGRGGSLVGFQ